MKPKPTQRRIATTQWVTVGYQSWQYVEVVTQRIIGWVDGQYHSWGARICVQPTQWVQLGLFTTDAAAKRAVEVACAVIQTNKQENMKPRIAVRRKLIRMCLKGGI